MYAGVSVEGGQLWRERSDVDFGDLQGVGSIYLAVLGSAHQGAQVVSLRQ